RPEPFYLYNFADRRIPSIEDICQAFSRLGLPGPRGTAPRFIVETGGLGCEVLNACGIRNPINRIRIHKLLYSTNVSPAKLMSDGYPFAFNLETAIGDWLANDPDVRPVTAAVAPRALEVPAINIEFPQGLRPAAPVRANAG